jgi:WD40-like Beta Propeller Repeat
MTDERVDALIRRLDVQAEPDAAFVSSTTSMLVGRVRAARVQDASRLGRLRRDVRLGLAFAAGERVPRSLAVVAITFLLLFAGLIAAFTIGRLLTPKPVPPNGPLIVSAGGQLRSIDVDTGLSNAIGAPGEIAFHITRSPDSAAVAFWRPDPDGDRLTFMDVATHDRRAAIQDVPVRWGGCIDTWSPDSRWLASEVTTDGASRILVVDSGTGIGHFITPKDVVAHCPLWSPDGEMIAFTLQSPTGSRSLAIVRTDGSGQRVVSGGVGRFQVSGPDTWSPDGAWIYFDAQGSGVGRVYRANVAEGHSTALTDASLLAVAPASSPDGTLIAFIVSRPVGWELFVANSDGTNPHRVAQHATNMGWSADGRYILARWTPPDQAGGLAIVAPDGSGFRVVVPADQACPKDEATCDVGWGQARP